MFIDLLFSIFYCFGAALPNLPGIYTHHLTPAIFSGCKGKVCIQISISVMNTDGKRLILMILQSTCPKQILFRSTGDQLPGSNKRQ